MNLFNGANLTPRAPSVTKMKRRGCGRESSSTSSSPVTVLDILQRNQLHGVNITSSRRSNSDNAFPHHVLSSGTEQANTTIILDSSSEPESESSPKCEQGSRSPDRKERPNSRKSLQFSFSQEPQQRFGDPPQLKSYLKPSPRETISQPLSPKSQSVEKSISKAFDRIRKIRARRASERKEDPRMGPSTILSTPTSRPSTPHGDEFPIHIPSDDEVIIDKEPSEKSGRPRRNLTKKFSSINSPTNASSDVVELSDDDETPPPPPKPPLDKPDDNVDNIPTIDITESELDNKTLNCFPMKKTPRVRSSRNRKRSERNDKIKTESNSDCIVLEDCPGIAEDARPLPNAEPPNMNASLLEEEDLPGFGTTDQPRGFRHHIPGDNEEDVCEINQGHKPEGGAAVSEIISSDSETNKSTPVKATKPFSLNLSAAKEYAESYLLMKKREKGGEEDSRGGRRLRCRQKSKEVEEAESVVIEPEEISEVPNEQIGSTVERSSSGSDKTAENTKKSDEVIQVEERQVSGEKKKRGRKPGLQVASAVEERSSSDKTAVESERKRDEVAQEVDRQSSGEKKKRGRKPGCKVKPRGQTNSQLAAENPPEPYQYTNTVGGFIFNAMSKTQAEAKAPNPGKDDPVERKKRGRKPGGKNRPKADRERNLKSIVKRPKRKYNGKSKLKLNNNEPAVPECCFERSCCYFAGCTHGNNHKKPGKLPSLPEDTDFVFAEQLYQDNIEEINKRLLAQRASVDAGADSSGASDHNCDKVPKAIIQFPLDVVANGNALNGKEVLGFTVPLPPGLPENDGQTLETAPEDNPPKPKIVQDKLLPKGTINHVLAKHLKTDAPRSTDAPGSPKREKFGIRSTIPSRRCLNPSADAKTIDSKISSAFAKIWKRIPEIAALMESPSKRICRDESFDEDTTENDQILEETRPLERRKSHLSESISNTDLKNGHIKAVGMLNGLFSDPHILPSSGRSRQSGEKVSRAAFRPENGQQINSKKYEDKLNDKSEESISRLTKENLAMMDESTDAQDGIDVMSHIMRQMQMPGKPVFPPMTPLSPPKVPKKSSEDSKKHENTPMSVRNSRKRVAAASVQDLEMKKRMKGKGQWSLNNDDAESTTSVESRPSEFISHPSHSSYLLSIFDRKSPPRKEELIQAWLSKDTEDSKHDADDVKSLENSHSPHSAKTCVRTPDERDDDFQMGDTVDTILEESSDADDWMLKIGSEKEHVTEGVRETDLCSGSSSSKTVSNSLKESSSGIGTEKEKQSSFETGDGDDDAPEVLTATVSQGGDDDDGDEKEDEDALFLDVEDDDSLMDESPENNENKESKVKQPPKICSPPRAESPPTINPNESPQRRPSILKAPVVVSRGESSKAMARPPDWDEDEASTSGLYQMSNVDRYCSQNRRECSIQYSGVDDPDAYEPGDVDDLYEPVQTQADKMFFPKDPRQFFRGLCYAYLKKGSCTRLDCPFDNNKYSYHLQNLPKAPPAVIELVLSHAIAENYFHALLDIYPEAIKTLPLQPIQRVCARIRVEAEKHKTKVQINYSAYRFYQDSMKPTVAALSAKNHSPATIIDILSKGYLLRDDDDMKKLMRVLIASKKIPPGHHWDTFKDLIKLLNSSPPQFLVSLILNDCIRFDKSREYLVEVYEHVIRRIPEPSLQGIDPGLLRPFRQFSEAVRRPEGGVAMRELANGGNRTPMPDVEQDFGGERQHCPQIASPDEVRHAEKYQEEERKEKTVTEPRRRSVKERLGPRDVLNRPRRMTTQEPLDLIPIGEIGSAGQTPSTGNSCGPSTAIS
ncbi:titin homolog isoform X2 [Diachasma alloeum]|uniref:titin homolog isoform X2 n=1 Tax=Diachasma alloeum TaxID=454923 RepID=UPI0007385114|nr:titin homolog isoform X2 [Diachasma alloeum]